MKIQFTFLFALSALSLSSQVVVDGTAETYQLRGKCSYLLDTVGWSINDVYTKEFDDSYQQDWYAKDAYYWISFVITNTSDWDDFILTIDQWERAELYYFDGFNVNYELSGTEIAVSERPEALHRLLTFPIHQPRSTERTYFLKVRVTDPFVRYYMGVYDFLSKLEWQVASSARAKFIFNQVIIFFVLGLCFALAVFNSVRLFFNFRKELYYLVGYILVTALFISNIHGVATLYLLRSFVAFELQLGFILVHISSILIALYVRSFLKTKGFEIENVLLMVMTALMICSLLYAWIDQQPHWYYLRRYAEGGLLAITLLIAMIKGRKEVAFLLAAFFFALAGRYVSEALATYDLFVWSDIPYLVGFMLQLSLFTIGSSVRMNRLESDVTRSIRENQQILENQNKLLNAQVAERTQELSDRNLELRKTIEELKDTQHRLVETENMAAIGRITGGLAHELNNPLNVIGGMIRPIRINIEELIDHNKPDPKSLELYDEILALLFDIEVAASKATNVVKNLSKITPGRLFQKRILTDLTDLIHDVAAPYIDRYPLIEFRIVTPGACIVDIWPEETAKMVENILQNAVDSVDGTGNGAVEIQLTTSGNYSSIIISDNGSGIHPDEVPHIFEPFYTTKVPGKGTGLGLFISKAIAVKHGGAIEVTSSPGLGSTFEIRLLTTL